LRECERAIGLDRNLAAAHADAGLMKVILGRGEETEAHVAEAMRLSPRDPLLSRWHFYIGMADLYLGRVDQAVDPLRKSVELNSSFSIAHFFLAATLALMGRDAEAAEASAAGLRLDPNFSVAKFRSGARSDNPIYLEQRERIYEGMCKAGVPEE
jgi:tetratricopeptide (TPR) repeat protein